MLSAGLKVLVVGPALALSLVTATSTRALAQQLDASYEPRTLYGDIGILDMPSARNAPDGEISLTVGAMQGNQRFNFGFQILPWLSGSLRYSHLSRFNNNIDYYDRSFGLKIRLWNEGEYLPEASLGARDFIGTGLYGAEYIVFSKRVMDTLDLTLGAGWGRLSDNSAFDNPLGLAFPSFKTRNTLVSGTGGQIDFGQLFHGPKMGVFGGAVWNTPIPALDLLVEYSSDHYKQEVASSDFVYRTPVNVGVAYHPFDSLIVSAGWLYGTSYAVTATLTLDPTIASSTVRIGPEIPEAAVRTPEQQVHALNVLLSGKIASVPPKGGAWVQIPTTQNPTELALTQALMSVASGVRDVEVMGDTAVINARFAQSEQLQCTNYAKIAFNNAPQLRTLVLSDLDDTSGRVAICDIPHRDGTPPLETLLATADTPAVNTPAPPTDTASALAAIRAAVSAQYLGVEALDLQPGSIWLYFTNNHYFSDAEAAGRVARVLMTSAPPDVEVFHLIIVKNGVPLRQIRIARSALERASVVHGFAPELANALSFEDVSPIQPLLDAAASDSYPRLHWQIGPGFRQSLFDPDRPYAFQVLVAGTASLELMPGLRIDTRIEANIYNNFDTKRPSNSLLPHVRSDFDKYFTIGVNGVTNLDFVYMARLSDDVMAEVKAGYLEDMFAGAGAQMLWRPGNQRISIGADIYQVWQRNFDRLAGLQDYHVLTGHISLYYQSPWYGLNFNIHAGRYLAGDYGATFEVTRHFHTGVEIGAFATFTNVPFRKFGEGSFDKGIIIRIPLEWGLPFYTQSTYDLTLRSLVRDGGQRLIDDDSLYDETYSASYGELSDHADEIVEP